MESLYQNTGRTAEGPPTYVTRNDTWLELFYSYKYVTAAGTADQFIYVPTS